MRLLLGHDADVAHWVASQIPHMRQRIAGAQHGQVFGPSSAIGVIDAAGQLVGGVVYHAYDPYCRSIELSCAAATRRWLTPDLVRALLRYPFSQVGCQRVTSVTPRSATSARRFLEKLGFKREGCIRRGFGSENAIVYGMLAEEWAASRLSREPAPERVAA